MDIRNSFRKALLTEEKGPHKYGCVILFLDVNQKWWDKIQNEIEDEDIYGPHEGRNYGREDLPHVTILYGVHKDVDDKEIKSRVEQIEAPKITLKKIGKFENDNFDVLKFDIQSDDLHNMNDLFKELPYTNDYPDYKPHATIAYLKKGSAKKYTKTLSSDDIVELTPTKVIYSKPDGSEKEFKIKTKK